MTLRQFRQQQQQQDLFDELRNRQLMQQYQANKKRFGLDDAVNTYNNGKTLYNYGNKAYNAYNNYATNNKMNFQANMQNNPNSVVNNLGATGQNVGIGAGVNSSPTLSTFGANNTPTLANYGMGTSSTPTLATYGTEGIGTGMTGATEGLGAIGQTAGATATGAEAGLGTIGGTTAATAGAGTAAGTAAGAGTAAAAGGTAATGAAAGAASAGMAAVPVIGWAVLAAKMIYDAWNAHKQKQIAEAKKAEGKSVEQSTTESNQATANSMNELEQNKQQTEIADPITQQVQQEQQNQMVDPITLQAQQTPQYNSPNEEILSRVQEQQPTIDNFNPEVSSMGNNMPATQNGTDYMSMINNALGMAQNGSNEIPQQPEGVLGNKPQLPMGETTTMPTEYQKVEASPAANIEEAPKYVEGVSQRPTEEVVVPPINKPSVTEQILNGVKDKFNNAKEGLGNFKGNLINGMQDLQAGFKDNVSHGLLEGDLVNRNNPTTQTYDASQEMIDRIKQNANYKEGMNVNGMLQGLNGGDENAAKIIDELGITKPVGQEQIDLAKKGQLNNYITQQGEVNDEKKSWMNRIGEGLGTAYRVANNPLVQGAIAAYGYNQRNDDPWKALEYGVNFGAKKASSDMYQKMIADEKGQDYVPNLLGGLTGTDYNAINNADYKRDSYQLRKEKQEQDFEKNFPTVKSYLDNALRSNAITPEVYNQKYKEAEANGTLNERNNLNAMKIAFGFSDKDRNYDEKVRHNTKTENIKQQNANTNRMNAGTNAARLQHTIKNDGVKNGLAQQKFNLQQQQAQDKQIQQDLKDKRRVKLIDTRTGKIQYPDIETYNKFREQEIKNGNWKYYSIGE